MKVFTAILKILAVLAAIAGIIYVIATYGDKLTACAKKLLEKLHCCCDCSCECCEEDTLDVVQVEDQDFEG